MNSKKRKKSKSKSNQKNKGLAFKHKAWTFKSSFACYIDRVALSEAVGKCRYLLIGKLYCRLYIICAMPTWLPEAVKHGINRLARNPWHCLASHLCCTRSLSLLCARWIIEGHLHDLLIHDSLQLFQVIGTELMFGIHAVQFFIQAMYEHCMFWNCCRWDLNDE